MSAPVAKIRQPLSELPLYIYVAQSLDSSPTPRESIPLEPNTPTRSRSPSLPLSQRASRSVSPHKQAVLQSHRRVREGSVSATSVASLSETQQQDGLEHSGILPSLSSVHSHFSPKNIVAAAHHQTPTTPSGVKTTPLNLRLHRPARTSEPITLDLMQPSPSTQRYSDPRLSDTTWQKTGTEPATPSRSKHLRAASPFETFQTDTSDVGTLISSADTSLQDAHMCRSLPKKKHRVSRTEIAIAHEEADAGPIGSPSPCKTADYLLPSKNSAPSAASFVVYEDPPVCASTSANDLLSDMRPASPSPGLDSLPSTPNKENRVPDLDVPSRKVVPIALPDRSYSASAVPNGAASTSVTVPRKRGTGGRLSLLANALEEHQAAKDSADGVAMEVTLPNSENDRNQEHLIDQTQHAFAVDTNKLSTTSSPEAGRGRRKVSARHTSQAGDDKVSSRTRSRT